MSYNGLFDDIFDFSIYIDKGKFMKIFLNIVIILLFLFTNKIFHVWVFPTNFNLIEIKQKFYKYLKICFNLIIYSIIIQYII